MKKYKIETETRIKKIYEIEAESEDDATDMIYRRHVDPVDEEDDEEVIDVELIDAPKKFKVVLRKLETITYEIEAEDEKEAIDISLNGLNTAVNSIREEPEVVSVDEMDE